MKKSTTIFANIASETEKALKVEITWQHLETPGRLHKYFSWLPKSQSTVSSSKMEMFGANEIEVPMWLADKIGNEIREKFGMCKHLGGNGIVYNF